jgi:DNA-binding MarR family transcriptional regulator
MSMQGTGLRAVTGPWLEVTTFVSAVEAGLARWLTTTYGLGLTEYRALVHLSKAPDRELRVNDLAHKVGLNQSSVTRLLSRLEGKSLVYRDTCPDDGRGIFAVLTDKGEDTVRKARDPYETTLSGIVTDVARPDSGQLGRALGAISDRVLATQ